MAPVPWMQPGVESASKTTLGKLCFHDDAHRRRSISHTSGRVSLRAKSMCSTQICIKLCRKVMPTCKHASGLPSAQAGHVTIICYTDGETTTLDEIYAMPTAPMGSCCASGTSMLCSRSEVESRLTRWSKLLVTCVTRAGSCRAPGSSAPKNEPNGPD